MRLMTAILGAILLAAVEASAQPSRTFDIQASDGRILKASYLSPATRRPGVLLFHQCSDDASRTLWNPLANALRDAGFHVLSYDSRGFGETAGEMPEPPPPPPRPTLPASRRDMRMCGRSSCSRACRARAMPRTS